MKTFEQIPVIKTKRLILKPFTLADASSVRNLAAEWEVTSSTLLMPGVAEEWIDTHKAKLKKGNFIFAITHKTGGCLIGCIEIRLNKEFENAELGYWIGKPFWNHGYCTEAALSIVKFGFESLKLNRFYAYHISRNTASGKVLTNIGMKHEGCLRQHSNKWGRLENYEVYGVSRLMRL
jgi:RimJ/RimL family protein N-acetyltransferase